jgi:LemA protein
MVALIIFIGILLLPVIYAIVAYNSLVGLTNRKKEAWADVDVQLKRRYDLIPNLVETVKGYAAHEKDTLERVIKARGVAMGAKNPAEKGQAENFLTGALKSLFALAEQYPNLKANENFMQLQNNLNEIEDALQNARRYYNATVRDINNKVVMFPSNIIAGMFGFKVEEFFEITGEEREAPKVKF